MNRVKFVLWLLVSAAVISTAFFVFTNVSAVTCCEGVLFVTNDGTVYIVKNGERRGFPSLPVFLSYGYTFSELETQSDDVMSIPEGQPMIYADGTLVRTSDGTVYIISGGQKQGFTSFPVFQNLGYQTANLITDGADVLNSVPDGPVIDSAQRAHPAGTLINDNGTVYQITGSGRKGVPSIEIFSSHGWRFQKVTPSNDFDRSLSSESLVEQRSVVYVHRPSSPTITGQANALVNTSENFTIKSTDPDGDDLVYEITWGDGLTDSGVMVSGFEYSVSHSWKTPGDYVITARVKDNYQNTSQSEFSVRVSAAAAAGPAAPPQINNPNQAITKLLDDYNAKPAAQKSAALPGLWSEIAVRKTRLIGLAKTNPHEFLKNIMSAADRARVPQELRSEVEEQVTLEGALGVIHKDDFVNKKAEYSYTLTTADKILNLHSMSDTSDPLLYPRARVRISGWQISDEIVSETTADNFQILAWAAADPPTPQNWRVLGVMVNFQDSPPEPFSRDQAEKILLNGQLNNFYREASYGKTIFTGDVLGWYTLPRSGYSADGVCTPPYLEEAYNLIRNTVDIRNYDSLALFNNHSCMSGGYGSLGKTIMPLGNGKTHDISFSGISSSINSLIQFRPVRFEWKLIDYYLAHELGHNLGVLHANAWVCISGDPLYGQCGQQEYGNGFDVMGIGISSLHFNALFKERFGWLDNSSMLTINTSGRYTIRPVESANGFRGAKIQLEGSTFAPFYLEYRKATGFDAALDGTEFKPNSNGLLVNWDIRQNNSEFTLFPSARLLDFDPGASNIYALNANTPAFRDAARGVTIGPVISADDSEITFDVAIDNKPQASSVTIYLASDSPPSAALQAGSRDNVLLRASFTASQDTTIQSIAPILVRDGGAGNSSIARLKLYDRSTGALLSQYYSLSSAGGGDVATFTNLNWSLPRNTTKVLEIRGDILETSTSATEQVQIRASGTGQSGEAVGPVMQISGIHPSIQVLTPNGSEQYQVGAIVNLRWSQANVNRVNIGYTNACDTCISLITSNYVADPNSSISTYSWAIPASLGGGGPYKIFIIGFHPTLGTAEDLSDSAFSITSAPIIFLGDTNLDGLVNIGDALRIANHVSGAASLTGQTLDNADVDGDGNITGTDSTLVAHWAGCLIADFPRGPSPAPRSCTPPTPPPIVQGSITGFAPTIPTINFAGSRVFGYSTDPDSLVLTYTIDWGDGSQVQSQRLGSGYAYIFSHVWKKPGSYQVSVIAQDESGNTSKTALPVEIR